MMSQKTTFLEELNPDDNTIQNIRKEYPGISDDVKPEVLVALRAGDHKAFDQVYTQYYRLLRSFISALLLDSEEAREITQEVFASLWENRDRIVPEMGVKRILYRMAKFQSYKHLRHQRVIEKYKENVEKTDIYTGSTDDLIISRETAILIEIALDRMPEKRREIYLMNKKKGLTYDEIVEITGLSKNTIRNHVATATKDLRKMISLFWVLFILS